MFVPTVCLLVALVKVSEHETLVYHLFTLDVCDFIHSVHLVTALMMVRKMKGH